MMAVKNEFLGVLAIVLFVNIHYADSETCQDVAKESHCKYWKSKGFCAADNRFRSHMESQCKKTCAFCVVDPCSSTPCKNNGLCNAKGTSFTCTCKYGFEGTTCETAVKKECINNPKHIENCPSWKKRGLCKTSSQYYGFMKDHCPLECGFCSVKELEEKNKCADSSHYASNCPIWKGAGFCAADNEYNGFMKQHCSKTCQFCKATCKDIGGADYCGKYKHYCKHSLAGETITKNCKKTCGACKETVVCGKGPDKSAGGRVVGGEEAQKNSWPWQAAMYKKGKFSCGGTLIYKKWVLTAAHCLLYGTVANDLKIVLGEHNRDKVEGTEQEFNVIRIVRHPKYNSNTKDNDIALLELSEEAVLNKYVGLACLPTEPPKPKESICFITGFGRTEAFGKSSKILMEAKLPIVSNKECAILNKASALTDNMMCGGYGLDFTKTQSGCQGDSGGPLVCMEGKTWSIQGVVSWGSSLCISGESYTVFERVARYVDWIKETCA